MGGDPRVLCRFDDLAERASRGFSLVTGNGTLELFVVRLGDAVYGYSNSCPHTGAPLDWQPDQFLDPDGMFIQCAMHGALFLIENGRCVRGPCAGRSLEAIPLRVSKGLVLLES